MNNSLNEYKYNNCSAKGICSVNPKTSSLQEVILLYIKYSAYYVLKLKEIGYTDESMKKLILFSVSVLASDIELAETDFFSLKNSFEKELERIISKYKTLCRQKDIKPELLRRTVKGKKCDDIITFIRLGEKEFSKKLKNFSQEKLNLGKILFYIIKSICINIITASDYDIDTDAYYSTVLFVLNILIELKPEPVELKQKMHDTAKVDFELMTKIHIAQTNRFGKQDKAEVSYTTKPGKAVLVVGSDLIELERILKSLREYNIYTHDEMLLAHTFPIFKNYPNLKGQYGMGFENCLLDFSTFPGPIILTRNSSYNVENLYRGRLFSTDFVQSKGVIKIKNNDYSKVIESAEGSKGFKTGKICESETIGFNYNEVLTLINEKLENGNYSGLVLLGNPEGDSFINEYYKILSEHIPDNYLIVSMFCCKSKNNLVCINAPYDNYAPSFIAENIAEKNKFSVNLFLPVFKRHTVTDLIYLSEYENINIFWNTKNNTLMNPSVIKTLCKLLEITALSTPKNDIEKLI